MLPNELQAALFLLYGHDAAARRRGAPVEEGAVTWAELEARRVTAEEMRALLTRGYVVFRDEHERVRAVSPGESWPPGTPFVLRPDRRTEVLGMLGSLPGGPGATGAARPAWKPEARELWYEDRLVLQLGRNAPCQEAILAAFHVDWWRSPIPNPLGRLCLPPDDPRECLRTAVKNLRNGVRDSPLTFSVRGGGRLVHWGLRE